MACTTKKKKEKKSPCRNLEFIKVAGKLLRSQNLVLYSCREETLIDLHERDQKESFVTKEKEA